MATDLFETIGHIIGRSTRSKISLQSNFYELGGNSLNSIITVTELCAKGYKISITSFIGAENLAEVLRKMSENANGQQAIDQEGAFDYKLKLWARPLEMDDKTDTIE
jgi:hypothetical protein